MSRKMRYSEKYKILFKFPPPPMWCKLYGYMTITEEYVFSRKVSEEEINDLPVEFTYNIDTSYKRLLKAMGVSMPTKEQMKKLGIM